MVDEISKLYLSEDEFESFIRYVGSLLDNSSFSGLCYSFIFSSLEVTYLKDQTETKNKRNISFIPLANPGLNIALNILSQPDSADEFLSYNNYQTLLWMASSHWRSLEAIRNHLTRLKKMSNLSDMVDLVLSTVPPSFTLQSGEDCIARSISADYLDWDFVITSNLTLEQCVSHGYFKNSTEESQNCRVIPVVSVLMVEQWARENSNNSHLACLFRRMFQLDTSGSDCYTFEKFHCYWEAIRYYSLNKVLSETKVDYITKYF
jgi:hypothetical protein